MTITPQQIEAGQAVYTPTMLTVYDWFVLGFSNRLIWRCPSTHLLAQYNRFATSSHLDVGVGTGYFLDRCRFPVERPRIGLMDLNPTCLETTRRRISRYQPEVYRANVLEPIRVNAAPFESIGVNYLLHCLPGTIRTKGAVVRHLRPLLTPGGRVFGSTILQGGVSRNAAARKLMAFYNSKGIFTNAEDDLDGLRAMLSEHLTDVSVQVVGCVALFTGHAPR
jgi:ubiquinone/menaquinone biosynthesis C-methylase UbiE